MLWKQKHFNPSDWMEDGRQMRTVVCPASSIKPGLKDAIAA
jgi:hypothetical protein